MTYAVPQALIFQDLQSNPAAQANPLQAHISGGQAQLVRFNHSTEQALGALGIYDPDLETCYDIPSLTPGAILDTTYVKLWAKNALLQYFDDSSTCTVNTTGSNQIVSSSVNFAASTGHARNAAFYDRDVHLGDIVKVRAVIDSEPVVLWSYVQAILGVLSAAVTGAAYSDTNNDITQIEGTTLLQTVGPWNCVTATPDGTDYNGLVSGDINETYTIVVTAGSINGDFTTAQFRVLSASGNDDQAAVTPSANGVPTDIGTRGLTVTFSDTGSECSESASIEGVSPIDLIAGQTFVVTVAQAFAAPTATSGGTYTGPSDTSYKITVHSGGAFGVTAPTITVSTTTGIDNGGPYTVSSAGHAVAIGAYGVTVSFAGAALRAGDVYYIPVTAAAAGALRILALGHNVTTAIPASTAVEVTLFIPEASLEISQDRTGFSPLLNWVLNSEGTQICTESGIIAYDSTFTSDGVLMPLTLVADSTQGYTELFVEYRAWLCALGNQINFTPGDGTIPADLGTIDPDNPLAYGVYCATLNANGTPVGYTAVCDPNDPNAWNDVLDTISGQSNVYALAPLTRNGTVRNLFVGHVNNESSPENGLWREVFFAADPSPTQAILTHTNSTDGDLLLATLTQDPDAVGTAYTILQLTSANAAFQTAGVQPGDIVRFLFEGDGFGGTLYSEFVVAAIPTQDEIRLVSGPDAPVSVPEKFEIWRNLSLAQQATAIGLQSGAFGNRRVMNVWPDTLAIGGVTVDGVYAAALLAGAVSGVVPQQGMTNVQLSGITATPHSNQFSIAQLNTMAAGGTWILIQLPDGNIVTRHAVTTDIGFGDINHQEEMVTRNLDSISFRFLNAYAPFIGVTNVAPGTQAKLVAVTNSLITQLLSENYNTLLGAQIVSGSLVSLLPSATLADRYVAEINLGLPYPTNNIEGHLIVI